MITTLPNFYMLMSKYKNRILKIIEEIDSFYSILKLMINAMSIIFLQHFYNKSSTVNYYRLLLVGKRIILVMSLN